MNRNRIIKVILGVLMVLLVVWFCVLSYQDGYARDYGNNKNASQINLSFILDERARELYWEGHRRTDLIRYGVFTTNGYLWQWKGGVKEGTAVNSRYNIYPIPTTELTANPNLYNENY